MFVWGVRGTAGRGEGIGGFLVRMFRFRVQGSGFRVQVSGFRV